MIPDSFQEYGWTKVKELQDVILGFMNACSEVKKIKGNDFETLFLQFLAFDDVTT